MKHKNLLLLLIFFVLHPLHAQYALRLNEKNQSQTDYALSTIRKITFQNGDMIVSKLDNSIVNFAVDSIQNLVFIENPDHVEKPYSDISSGINLFPNPVRDYLQVRLLEDNQQDGALSIYNANGQLILSQVFTEQRTMKIDVSALPNGIYVCHYYDGTLLRVKKFVKY